jgi:hypothetical protein
MSTRSIPSFNTQLEGLSALRNRAKTIKKMIPKPNPVGYKT